jgi:hypothetical protein
MLVSAVCLGDFCEIPCEWQHDCAETSSCGFVFIRLPTDCLGDINRDGVVNQADLGILNAAYGTKYHLCSRPPPDPIADEYYNPDADLDGDGDVDQADLGILLNAWQAGCP